MNYTERVATVAHYRVTHLIEAHAVDAAPKPKQT